jgi:hypothetical protein
MRSCLVTTLACVAVVAHAAAASGSTVTIDELRTAGSNGAADEFVELYNASRSRVDISGWTLWASNDAGATGRRAAVPAGTTLAAGCSYLFAHSAGYDDAVGPDVAYGFGITDSGGVQLRAADGTPVDSVGFSSGSAFVEGEPLVPLAGLVDRGYGRMPSGTDGGDNAADFALRDPSTPQSSASPCARTGAAAVVIGEFRTRGPGAGGRPAGLDEFVELYNRTGAPVDVSGWSILASNGSGAVSPRVVVPRATTLGPGCHYLATNSSAAGDAAYTAGIPDDGGIAVVSPDGRVVDQVGTSTGSAFGEGTPLLPLASDEDRSYERRLGAGVPPTAADSGDNKADFDLRRPSGPEGLRSPCRGFEPRPVPLPLPLPAGPPPRHEPVPGALPPLPTTWVAKAIVRGRRATFRFGGTDALSFECRLDLRRYAPCRSPRAYRRLRPGRHTFRVRARNAVGAPDPTPAWRTVRVRQPRRRWR